MICLLLLASCQDVLPPNPIYPTQPPETSLECVPGKGKVLAVITTGDLNHATTDLENMFAWNLMEFKERFCFESVRVNSIEGLKDSIIKHAPVTTLILAFHGAEDSIQIGFNDYYSPDIEKHLSGYDRYLEEDANIILYSCSTGKDERSIAYKFSEVFRKDVIAPRTLLVPETFVAPHDRVGEFTLVDDRLDFDAEDYRFFRNTIFSRNIEPDIISTRNFVIQNAEGYIDEAMTSEDMFVHIYYRSDLAMPKFEKPLHIVSTSSQITG